MADRPYTHEMVIVHRVFRRESRLLPRLVESTESGDGERARVIADHVRQYAFGLRHHHHVEDELIWSLLHERAAANEALVGRMEDQHSALDFTLEQIARRLAIWEGAPGPDARDALVSALDDHAEVLIRHLNDEETLVLPLVAEHLSVPEWEVVGRRGLETLPKNKVMIALGAILEDATPDERRYFLGKVPAIGRLFWHAVGKRQYARDAARVRGSLSNRA